MKSSSKARVLLAVLRRCDVAWKKTEARWKQDFELAGARASEDSGKPSFHAHLLLPCHT